MLLFASDDEVSALEAEITTSVDVPSMEAQVALAWHLRERDSRRALALAQKLTNDLDGAPAFEAGPEAARYRLRLRLLQGYVGWLFADLAAAEAIAGEVACASAGLAELALAADAHVLLAHIAQDRGDRLRRAAQFELAAELAATLGDGLRLQSASLGRAIGDVRVDARAAMARWGDYVNDLLSHCPAAALQVLCNDFLAFEAYQRSDYAVVVRHCSHTVMALQHSGLVRQVAGAFSTLGVVFLSLNDKQQALEWLERGLQLARPTAWPFVTGSALMQLAETQRQLGNLSAAQGLLEEALQLLAAVPGSRSYAVAIQYLGELLLNQDRADAALTTAEHFLAQADRAQNVDIQLSLMQIRTLALSRLGRPEEALQAGLESLALAEEQGSPLVHSELLDALAALYARHQFPAPQGMCEASAVLHYLLRSLAALPSEYEYGVPPIKLDAIAAEYMRLGEPAQAYAYALRANAARERNHQLDVDRRTISVEARFQTERAQAEAGHLRQLAASAADRAELQAQTSATLARLGLIGQEITGHLQEQAVYACLNRNVQSLLVGAHFGVFLLDRSETQLELAFGMEDGQAIKPFVVPLSHPSSQAVRCAMQRREFTWNIDSRDEPVNIAPGTRLTRSAMFMPLMAAEQLLGVMSIQSTQALAYGEREQLIFRNLCAYGAIAIQNARNFQALEATLQSLHAAQAELVLKKSELEQAYSALEDVSLTDPLTGLRNRRFLEKHLAAEVSQSLRYYERWQREPAVPPPADADLLFLLVDIDHFKRVNDDWGHPAGDQVLVQMRERLARTFRDSDYLVRWGGEEFLVVARANHREQITLLAERVRAEVAGERFVIEAAEPLALTCSVGFACLPFIPSRPEALSWAQVVGLADQALYIAKRNGRNAWVGFSASARTAEVADPALLIGAPLGAAEAGLLTLHASRDLIS
ncbi:diguanylate cyclase [Roseateles oligotrophus]|uniref:diguanylate cyclase n=1 Tax=Roseateles oligotrophus TaxID=1769250 RepID=A0ABT2YI91_9BURK|nr:diguanylate cyclase [Roseateles oligotrophus]MCV2369783.1 diguanylate cyclase [Roseateles oligotrophus]